MKNEKQICNIPKANKYDKLIIIFIALQTFGLIGGIIRPVRVFTYLSILFVINYFLTHRKAFRYYKFEILYFIFWAFFAFSSLLWVIDLKDGMLFLYQLIVSICSFLTLIWLAEKSTTPQKSIVKGWIVLLILTLPIAFYEIIFDWHLPMSVQEEGATLAVRSIGVAIYRRFASITFGNLNTYNLVLCYSFTFLLLAIDRFTGKKQLFINVFLLFSLCYIILTNSSRAAILVIAMGLLIFLRHIFLDKKVNWGGILVFICLAVFLVIQNFETLFGLIFLRFAQQGFEDDARSRLLAHAWDAFLNSNLIGIGVGNMRAVMMSVYNENIVVIHNLFMEILLQYGLIVFLGFLFLLWRIMRKGMRSPINRWFILLAMSVLLVSSVLDAQYLAKDYIWIFLASLSIVVDKRYSYK